MNKPPQRRHFLQTTLALLAWPLAGCNPPPSRETLLMAYTGAWIGMGKVLMPASLFEFELMAIETGPKASPVKPIYFNMRVNVPAKGQPQPPMTNRERPAAAGISFWLDNGGCTAMEIFERASEWDDERKVVFVKEVSFGSNRYLHGQTTQKGADDGSISSIVANIDHRLDTFVLTISDTLSLVIQASREIAMNAKKRARLERDAIDPKKQFPGSLNSEQYALDAEARYQTWRDQTQPHLDAALPVVLSNVQVFQHDPFHLPAPKPGLERHYLWNCAIDFPTDKLIANGCSTGVMVSFGDKGKALWVFEDKRIEHEGRFVGKPALDEEVQRNIDKLFTERQRLKMATDPDFAEVKGEVVRVGNLLGLLNEFYLTEARFGSSADLGKKFYKHETGVAYADGHMFSIATELPIEQMRVFRGAFKNNYVLRFLPLLSFPSVPGRS